MTISNESGSKPEVQEPEPSEFDRFKSLVKQVVSVSKGEVDRRQAEEQAEKLPRTQGRQKKAA